MKGLRFLTKTAVSLSCLGLLFQPTGLLADQPPTKSASPKTAIERSAGQRRTHAAISDIALSAGGTLTGHVVDSTGRTLPHQVVSLRQSNREITRTASDQSGRFVVKELRGGVYQIVAGQGSVLVRLWAPNTAPPSARENVLVSGHSAVRFLGDHDHGGIAGLDVLTMLTVGATIGAVTLLAITYDDLKDLEDRVDRLVSP